jgi:hypothetical protein
MKKKISDRIATKELGRDRVFFLDRDPWSVATGIFFGSRPVVGRKPQEYSSRDLDRVEFPNTISYRPSDRTVTKIHINFF